jgi:glycolate oxidase iron-sulfur subunit
MEFAELAALFKCNKCGSCTSVCPLYQNTVNEGMAARGKVALLEAVADGRLQAGEAVRAKLEDCLLCGACATNCPSFVPTTDLFLEARAGLAKDLGQPPLIRALLLALATPGTLAVGTPGLHLFERLGFPEIANGPLGDKLPPMLRAALRSLPPAPLRSYRSRAKRAESNGTGARGTVGYFAGCFMNWGYADAAMATRQMLGRAGFRVEAPSVMCCGVPHRAYGDIETAKKLARKNIEALEKYDHVVSDCASCGAALKEYTHLLKDDPAYAARAEKLAARAADISEFLVKQEFPAPEFHTPLRVTYHDPCHLVRGQGVKSQPRELLKAIPGVEYVEMQGADVCCGAAGSFCVMHPELSEGVGGNKADSILETKADVVVSGCPSCLTQLKAMLKLKGSSIKVMHPMELLAESYRTEPADTK